MAQQLEEKEPKSKQQQQDTIFLYLICPGGGGAEQRGTGRKIAMKTNGKANDKYLPGCAIDEESIFKNICLHTLII